jgi:DNA-binding helix-turn-helix protein
LSRKAGIIIPKEYYFGGELMKRIASLRKEKGISQVALAMELNVSQKTISSYESGKNQPNVDILKKLASYFGTSVDYIIEHTDIKQPLNKLLDTTLTSREGELLNLFRDLTEEKKLIAIGVLMGLKQR